MSLKYKSTRHETVNYQDFPASYFSLTSYEKVAQRIEKLAASGANDAMEAVVRFYCIPTKEYRESCLRDIMHMLTHEAHQMLRLPRSKEYVLLH